LTPYFLKLRGRNIGAIVGSDSRPEGGATCFIDSTKAVRVYGFGMYISGVDAESV